MSGIPKLITINGETRSISEWSRVTGVSQRKISCRLRRGVVGADLLFTKKLKTPGKQRTRAPFIDFVGKRVGRLQVMQFVGVRDKDNQRIWFCQCDCGGTTDATSRDLKRGSVASCGCLFRKGSQGLAPGASSLNSLYSNYSRSASYRGYLFELSKVEFRDLTSSPCFYCGAEPIQPGPFAPGTKGQYLYNGIDRIDNDLGYTIFNVRPCCKVCNYAKGTLTEDQFFAWAAKVYDRLWVILEERGAFSGIDAPDEEPELPQPDAAKNLVQWRKPT